MNPTADGPDSARGGITHVLACELGLFVGEGRTVHITGSRNSATSTSGTLVGVEAVDDDPAHPATYRVYLRDVEQPICTDPLTVVQVDGP